MPELYPSELQQNFSKGSFSRNPGNNVLVSEMETGPIKKRRRSTLRRDVISGSILLRDTSEYVVFDTWFTSTLQDGVKPFYFNDPVTGSQLTVTFVGSNYAISDVGFETYSVTMTWEVING